MIPSARSAGTAVLSLPLLVPLAGSLPFARPGTPSDGPPVAARVPGEAERCTLAWGDYDGDGLDDAWAVQPDGTGRLLHNLGGRFEDVTTMLGLAPDALSAQAVWHDVDGDGAPDLLLHGAGAARFLRNLGGVGFEDWTESAGLAGLDGVASAGFVDVDADGVLDLHVVRADGHRIFGGRRDGTFVPLELPLEPAAGGGAGVTGVVGRVASAGSVAPAASASGAVRERPDTGARARGGERADEGGTAALGAAATGSSLLPGQSAVGGPPVCAIEAIRDQATGLCLEASSTPTYGALYPLGDELFIDAVTGDVGIGTTSPAARLHVADGSSGTTPWPDGALLLDSASGPTVLGMNSAEDEACAIRFGNPQFGEGTGVIVFNDESTLPDGLSLGTGNVPRIGIDLHGLVGINTLDLTHILNVRSRGDRKALRLIGPGTNGTGAFVHFGTNDDTYLTEVVGAIEIRGAAGTAITGGDVGVGTTTPGARFHVQDGEAGFGVGSADLAVETDHHSKLNVMSPQDTAASLNLYSGISRGGLDYDLLGTKDLMLVTDGIPKVMVTEMGRVGVNTFDPDAWLHVWAGDSGVAIPTPPPGMVVESSVDSAIEVLAGASSTSAVHFGNGSTTSDAGAIEFNPAGLANGLALRANTARSVKLAASGNVGVGTEAPVRPLHVTNGSSGGTPTTNSTLAVESSGEASISVLSPDASEASIFFGNPTAGANAGAIVFNPFGGALPDGLALRTSDTNRLTITSGGNVGIGVDGTTFKLEVNGSAAKPGGGSWSVSSDVRLKKNVRDLEDALATLLALRGVTFEYRDPEAVHELPGERIGFIAQEVEQVIPDWVEEVDGYERLTVRGFEALAVEALRELDRKEAELAEANARLAEAQAELATRVDRLEALEGELAGIRAALATLGEGR